MDIFMIQNNIVVPTPEALLIYPFSSIWEQNDKSVAMLKLSYIEFMCSRKRSNPFIDYHENDRQEKVLTSLFPNDEEKNYEIITEDNLVKIAMATYNRMQDEASPSLKFYEASLIAAEQMVDFFTTFDLSELNMKTGNPLYKPADITRALKDVDVVLKTMNALKSKVIQELYDDSKAKGGREINYFERAPNEK